jgi:hypothetical protein
MLRRTGAWIFVSHSLQDFSKVRRVRDALEDLGHFPLLFYLRSIGDDAEVDALIRREIQARNFFLLCDSENARKSRWVQQEVQIIKSQPRKLFARLELDWPWQDQLRVIEDVSARMSIFISASAVDRADADAISAALERADSSILGRAKAITPGEDMRSRVRADIDEALSTGLVVVLLSPEAVAREESYQWLEVNYALERSTHFAPGRPTVLPVVLRDFQGTMAQLPPSLRTINALDLSHLQSSQKPDALLRALEPLAARIDA